MADTLILPPDLAAKLQAHIDAGGASDPVEVVRAGLDALEAAEAAKLEAVRAKIARSLADSRPSIAADDAFGRVEAMIEELGRR